MIKTQFGSSRGLPVQSVPKSCKFESRSWRGVLDTPLCDKVCQCPTTDRWFSPVSSTNKTDRHDITEILLKVALNTITLTLTLRLNLKKKYNHMLL